MIDPRTKSAAECFDQWLKSDTNEVKEWEISTLRVSKIIVSTMDDGSALSEDEVRAVAKLAFRDAPIEQVLKSHITHRECKSKWVSADDAYSKDVPWSLDAKNNPDRKYEQKNIHRAWHTTKTGNSAMRTNYNK